MANQYVNKVVVIDEMGTEQTKLDLTQDNIEAKYVINMKPGEALEQIKFHDATGASVTGTIGSTDLGANNANGVFSDIAKLDDQITVGNEGGDPTGESYFAYRGYATVGIDATEKAKIIAENIKKDVEILGVTGTLRETTYTFEDNDAGGQTLTIKA